MRNVDHLDEHTKIVDMVFSENPQEGERCLLHSVNEMELTLEKMGISSFDLDDLGETLLRAYDVQQQKYNDENTFWVLSLVGMALLELGVIVESGFPATLS